MDINKQISEFLPKVDPKKLNEAVKAAEGFIKTQEGTRLLNSLKNNPRLKEQIDRLTNSKDPLSDLQKSQIFYELTRDPEFLNAINNYLKNN